MGRSGNGGLGCGCGKDVRFTLFLGGFLEGAFGKYRGAFAEDLASGVGVSGLEKQVGELEAQGPGAFGRLGFLNFEFEDAFGFGGHVEPGIDVGEIGIGTWRIGHDLFCPRHCGPGLTGVEAEFDETRGKYGTSGWINGDDLFIGLGGIAFLAVSLLLFGEGFQLVHGRGWIIGGARNDR